MATTITSISGITTKGSFPIEVKLNFRPDKVIFRLTGPNNTKIVHTESSAPYIFLGDGKKWNSTKYPDGEYRMVVNAYKYGRVVATKDTRFTIQNKSVDPTPVPTPEPTPQPEPQNPSEPVPANTIIVEPNNLSVLSTIKSNTTYLFRCGSTYNITKTISISGSNVKIGAIGSGNKPVIFVGTTTFRDAFSVGGSAKNIVIEDIMIDSNRTSWGKGPYGVSIHGNNVICRRITMGTVHYAFSLNEYCSYITIEYCTTARPKTVQGYFIYAKGKHITIRYNDVDLPMYPFIRSNLVEDLNVYQNKVVGNPNDAIAGRITIQKANKVIIRDNDLVNVGTSYGPLSNCDGLRGEGSVAKFQAARTYDVLIENNRMSGTLHPHKISCRIEGLVWRNNTGRKPSIVEKDFKVTCDGQTISLANSKDIWVDGVKIA
jgi:hypothetical protein